jgi:hypothetical protein
MTLLNIIMRQLREFIMNHGPLGFSFKAGGYVDSEPQERDWPKGRWENYIKEDLGILKTSHWTNRIQDRVKWKEVFEKVNIQKQKL